jgi:spermidine/putrescine transport system permease protein
MNRGRLKTVLSKDLSFFMAVPAFVWLLLFLYLPLLFIIGLSFIKKWSALQLPELGLNNYFTFFDSIYYSVLVNSLMLAFTTALVCLICAYPIAYFLALHVHRWKSVMLFLLALPFGVNFIILAYAWFFILEKTGLINSLLLAIGIIKEPIQLLNSPFAIYLGMIYCYLPFMVLPIYAILEKLDLQLVDASLDLGASRLMTFLRVILPLSMPGIQTGFFIVFIPAFGEYVIPTLMGGGKFLYVGSLITHYFLLLRNLSLGAAFTCFSSLLLLIVALLLYWRFRKAT